MLTNRRVYRLLAFWDFGWKENSVDDETSFEQVGTSLKNVNQFSDLWHVCRSSRDRLKIFDETIQQVFKVIWGWGGGCFLFFLKGLNTQ